MTHTFLLDRQVQALTGPSATQSKDGSLSGAVTIALARETGTPVSEVARAVGARLGWPIYDHELIERVAEKLGKSVELLELIDEKPQSWMLECLEAISSGPKVSERRYMRNLTRVIRDLGDEGHCLIIGRGATQILPRHATLRVYLVAPLEDRIEAFRRAHPMSWQEATQRVNQLDEERKQFVAKHFHKDALTPENYDLVLNTSEWSVTECADLILQALWHREGEPAGLGAMQR